MQFTNSLIKFLTNYFFTSPTDKEALIPQGYKSHDYERKLALIVKNTEIVDYQDLKYVIITKLDTKEKNDLLSAYRLDFHTRDHLKKFKKKYKSLLL